MMLLMIMFITAKGGTMENPLKKLREDKGWSQSKLALLFDVSPQRISTVERGAAKSFPSSWLAILKERSVLDDSAASKLSEDYSKWREHQLKEMM